MSNQTALPIRFVSKDNNYQDEKTNYWFNVDGEIWGISNCNGDIQLLDCDGCPVEPCNDRDGVLVALKPHYEAQI